MEQADFWIILGVTSQKSFKNHNYTESYITHRSVFKFLTKSKVGAFCETTS